MWCIMFKNLKNPKNYLNCSELIIKAMYKRRKLAFAAIAHVCNGTTAIRVIK